ncbi:MAG TPA: NmrA family NAD(P)-binding protein [Actinoplanes sp.]|nr:NmrA family NAD(P)-binding protein [Actinoplanes sp.]
MRSSNSARTVLVVGGTGAMGSSVVRRLLATSDDLLVVPTRDPDSPRSVRLAELGAGRVTLFSGALDAAAMSGIDRVFANTNFFAAADVLTEYRQGIDLLEAARAAGVDRFVWSSLDAAATLTGGTNPVPHYDTKAAVAAHINLMRAHEMMRQEEDGWYTEHVSVLVTAPYFENLYLLAPQEGPLPDGRDGLLFSLALGDGRWPLIALDDIAWFVSHMFESWQGWGERDLAVVGDSLTGQQIASVFERVTGVPSAYHPLPLTTLRDAIPQIGHDFAAMFRFFQSRDIAVCDRDIDALQKLHPELMTFEAWLRATNWDGRQKNW